MKIYQCGGSVRDKLMGHPVKDIDLAVEAISFDAMRQEVLDRGCKIFLESPQFFTIRAKHPDLGPVDFSLCRKDGIYRDGRRPESVSVGTIYDDLARRDFCINAMAIDLETGELIDPFNGQADIEAKLIRAVGDVKHRFEEDKLRALRALRFSVTKGLFLHHSVDEAILTLSVQDFAGTSTDRIRDELFKMFAHDTATSIEVLHDYPVITKLIKERAIWLKPTVERV